MNTTQAVARMREELGQFEDVRELVQFIETAKRGIVK
jgi:acyl-[acyl carrier protein]--UDP-N-acetylglucosamine O-acyltransferase